MTYDPTSWYYDYEGESIPGIIERWAVNDPAQKMYDRSMPVMFSINELWQYREYTWTRENARSDGLIINGEFVSMDGKKKWDILKEFMKKDGYNLKYPLHVYIGSNGKAKVGEGNHRLAIAKEVGIKEIPVEFLFVNNVSLNPQFPEKDKIEIDSKEDVNIVIDAIVDDEEDENRELTPEEKERKNRVVNRIMDLLSI